MANDGKEFEARFKLDWTETTNGALCYRLNDQVSGHKGSSNISDFICYKKPNLYIIDCKSTGGNTLNFSDFRQYDSMLGYIGLSGVHLGTVIWFKDKDHVVWVPIETWKKLKDDGKKSYHINYLSGEYESFDIPSRKLRKFMSTDYSQLIKYCEGDC